MIYAIAKGGRVLRYQSLALLKKIHGGNAAYQTFAEGELHEAQRRFKSAKLMEHNGMAVIGKTDEEAGAIKALKEIESAKKELEGIDREFGHRAKRGIGLRLARLAGIPETDGDYSRLNEAEQRAVSLRLRIEELEAGLDGNKA